MGKAPPKPEAHPVLAAAMKHFAADDAFEVRVPEWGTEAEPCILYARPWTMEDRMAVAPKLRAGDPSWLVDVIVRKALDADGNKLFTVAHAPLMRKRVDPDVIERLAGEILMRGGADRDTAGVSAESIEDAEGN